MPARQGTFHVVPTSLVPIGPSRPPMTSKAAKKAHRQSTKLPGISKAEQRRLEAAELESQRKEYQQQKKEEEKERAGARAKAAREKKLKKEKEEKEERRRQGIPEKSKWVRPSQPCITGFVKAAVSRKRNRDDSEESDSTAYEEYQLRSPKEIMATEPSGDNGDDDFGDFPSMSQGDLPALLELADGPFNPEIRDFNNHPQTGSLSGSLQKSVANAGVASETEREFLDDMERGDMFSAVIGSQSLSESSSAVDRLQSTRKQDVPDVPPLTLNFITATNEIQFLSPASENTSLEDMSSMHPSPTVVARKPLEACPGNMAPPPLPQRIKHPAVASKVSWFDQPIQQTQIAAIPSTQAFLESHWDEFFPSPSQQVRELLEEMDHDQDIPSNTQIARELDELKTELHNVVGDPNPRHTESDEHDTELHFSSSQDFMISSQDLREMESIDLPNITGPEVLPQVVASQEADSGLKFTATSAQTVRSEARLKPRFFEEKEDDLLQAALRESLLVTNKQLWSSSPTTKKKDSCGLPPLVPEDEFSEEEFDGDGNGWVDNDGAIQAAVEQMLYNMDDLVSAGWSVAEANRFLASRDDPDWN